MFKQLLLCDQSIDTFFASFSPFYKRVEEKGKEQKDKRKDHGTVDNLYQDKSLIN